jgi:hypothetical protein
MEEVHPMLYPTAAVEQQRLSRLGHPLNVKWFELSEKWFELNHFTVKFKH